jgi:hypothetical protein
MNPIHPPLRALPPKTRDYATKTRDYEPSTRDYETKARDYETKARDYETKARDYETKARDYETKARDYETKARDYETKARDYATKARDYVGKTRVFPSLIYKGLTAACLVFLSFFTSFATAQEKISQEKMRAVYEEVKTPYKYGLVVAAEDNMHKVDCPTVFRKEGKWYMSYLVYDGKGGTDGRGYETWLAESEDLLTWETVGRILPFGEAGGGRWDENQRAGYMALVDHQWGGSYEIQPFNDKYWLSYFGGRGTGYEQGRLEVGIAYLDKKEKENMASPVETHGRASCRDGADPKGRILVTAGQRPAEGYLPPATTRRGEPVRRCPTLRVEGGGCGDRRSLTCGYEDSTLRVGAGGVRRDASRLYGQCRIIGLSQNQALRAGWTLLDHPVLSPLDADRGWWESITQYKSSVIWDREERLGSPFVLFYNAGGVNPANGVKAERIGIALSDDMLHWRRYAGNPVVNHEEGITGDGVVQQVGDLYVMFYFGAFWKNRPYQAFNTFACSNDLVHWTDWEGEDLIIPTEKYDDRFAHKSCVVKWEGVVYHFYCAVNGQDQRGIAVATSVDKGRSLVRFPKPDKETFRKEVSLNAGWKTVAAEGDAYAGFEAAAYDDAGWEAVDVPHNWDKYEGARRVKHGNRHGTAWYRKSFRIDDAGAGKRYFLYFEGVGSYATVYVNGARAGYHAGGRTTFTLDITDKIQFKKENIVAVKAEHPPMIADLPWVCGGCSSEWGFSEGSQPMGIFRPVTLVVSEDVRVEPFGVHAWNPAPEFQGKDTVFTLNINTEIKNYGERARRLEIIQKLVDKDGRQVERVTDSLVLQPNELRTVRQQGGKLSGLHVWDTERPYLYRLVTMIKEDGRVVDQETTAVGFRWISWPAARNDGDGRFYLNGRATLINGVCEYENILGGSHAFSEEQILSRVGQIRAAGFNAFRDGHQPHNLLYQEQWNRLGMLFWTQFSAHIWYDTPEFRANFKNNLREWVRERRSSPSVILWGLQNESVLPEAFARECVEIIREMDPTSPAQRLVTTCNGGVGTDWNVIQNWSGTYGGKPENYASELSRPDQLLNGEYGAWRSIGLHTDNPDGKIGDISHTETYMTRLLEQKIRLAEQARDSVCGQFLWVYASHDNPGRVQNEEGARDIDRIGPFNYKGLATPWEEPLDAYYLYRANYVPARTSPMVYLVSHTWSDRWAEAGLKDNIVVYSNCGEVELFNDMQDGSLGRRRRDGVGTHFQWDGVDVRYNVLRAVGYEGGKAVAEDYIVLDHLPPSPNFSLLYKNAENATAPAPHLHYIYRLNCGGGDYTDENGNVWYADNKKAEGNFFGSLSWADDYPHLPAFLASQRFTHDPIAGTREWELFQTFRYGRDRLKFQFPLPDGEYEVDLYFIEPWWGTGGGLDAEGFRVFDVAINGETVLKDLDIWKEAGHDRLLKKTVRGMARGGLLEISFPRVKAGQAVVSAIAIASQRAGIAAAAPSPVFVPDATVPEETEARPAVAYAPTQVSDGAVEWEILPGLAGVYALRFRYQNPGNAPIDAKIRILSADDRVMREDVIQFPPTPNKWRILNTTTAAYINAGRYRLVLEHENIKELKFDNLEMQ